jgi:hypothetical protein
MFDLNPIAILKQREVSTLPPHFAKIKINDQEVFDGKVKSWIKDKLKGRYCVIRTPAVDQSGALKSVTFAAFEDQKELTYFMLACPYLRRN